ncbi:hypothetical protein E6C60_0804 [Paenibacillus algicola]|uniref:Uncharacterized protein n=1 Tax=Paenibacillus algicola TaxID=2565926 RepID=A0A4P8XGR4_9BACL|nr:hypothetical protein [Paenibacillus algicola]QCT01525.1 hypothetical protein E6C60_0804 [Paenibacillus algicola]
MEYLGNVIQGIEKKLLVLVANMRDPDTTWSFKEQYRGYRETIMDFAVWTKQNGGVGVSSK